MNMILFNKVKRDLKDADETTIKELVAKIQEKFDIAENSSVFEIEQKISDEEYSKLIKK